MIISTKKYAQLLQAIVILTSRPYLDEIVDNKDGTLTFNFVQDGKVYSFTAVHGDTKERTLQ